MVLVTRMLCILVKRILNTDNPHYLTGCLALACEKYTGAMGTSEGPAPAGNPSRPDFSMSASPKPTEQSYNGVFLTRAPLGYSS